jgi:serine/threonine protein kinase
MSRPTQTTGAPQLPGLVYVQPLGSGGYADVYLYEQQSPRMPVAVKVLRAEGLTDAMRRRFAEEADTMAQLGDHPYIVQIFRAGTSLDGRPYLVMKYYPPPNLARRARLQPLTVDEVLRTGIQLASAIETAHQAGVVHRDVKPANVLVSSYGAPGLTDFGIAGRGASLSRGPGGAEREARAEPTDVGVSVPWAPPEVLYAAGEGTERGDVYSLAATLWQLLVGRSPFEVPGGDNTAYALMPRIRSLPVPATGRPDVPASLERVLAQAMAKDPAHRPARAVDLARQLQAVEQELRLPRTPLVVLDQRGDAEEVGAGPAGDDDDRTRVKNVQQVRAQSSGAFAPTPDTLAAPATTDQSRQPLVLALAGVAVLLVLVGFLVLRPTSTPAPAPVPARTAVATQSATTDSAIGDGVFSAPVVTVTPKVGSVEFAWSYASPRSTDTYRVHVGSTPGDAQIADPVTVPKATYAVRVASGSTMCLVATVVRAGQISPASPAVCATAL